MFFRGKTSDGSEPRLLVGHCCGGGPLLCMRNQQEQLEFRETSSLLLSSISLFLLKEARKAPGWLAAQLISF